MRCTQPYIYTHILFMKRVSVVLIVLFVFSRAHMSLTSMHICVRKCVWSVCLRASVYEIIFDVCVCATCLPIYSWACEMSSCHKR